MEMRLRTPVTRGYFFLVNATSPPTISIDKKKISSGTQGTSILASFDITGRPFERVTYSSEGTTMRKMKGLGHITSMRIKVTDENGDLIDFNGLPLKFEIEIV